MKNPLPPRSAWPTLGMIAVLLLNLFVLGTSRINSVIRNVAFQGALLGLTPLILHGHVEVRTVSLVIAMVGVNGGLVQRSSGSAGCTS